MRRSLNFERLGAGTLFRRRSVMLLAVSALSWHCGGSAGNPPSERSLNPDGSGGSSAGTGGSAGGTSGAGGTGDPGATGGQGGTVVIEVPSTGGTAGSDSAP